METTKKINLIFIFSILAMVFSLFGTCSSCMNSKKISRSEISIKMHTDSATYSKDEMKLMMEIQGLKDERRSVLNINQIFLTQKRPDQRVIEIDSDIAAKEEKLKTLRK